MMDRVKELGAVKIGSGQYKGCRVASVPLLELYRMTRHPQVKAPDKDAIAAYLALPAVSSDLEYDKRMGRGKVSRHVVPDECCNEP
jgi:hypothetical protein